MKIIIIVNIQLLTKNREAARVIEHAPALSKKRLHFLALLPIKKKNHKMKLFQIKMNT